MKRIVATSLLVSSIFCTIFLILLPLSAFLRLPDYATDGDYIVPNNSITIFQNVRVGASRGKLWFTNGELHYQGSIMHISDDQGGIFYDHGKHARETVDWSWLLGNIGILQVAYTGEKDEFVGRDRKGGFPGIYYRHFEWWTYTKPWWTLAVHLCYPIAITAMLPGWWFIRRLRASRKTAVDS